MKIKIGDREFDIEDDQIKDEDGNLKGEVSLPSDGLVIRTSEEDNTFRDNIRQEGTAIGAEVGRKEVLKAILGEDQVNGQHKSDSASIEAIKGWGTSLADAKLKEANVEPDKKITELEADKQILQGTINDLQAKNTEVQGQFDTFKRNIAIDNAIMSNLPDNLAFPKDGILTIIKQKQQFDVDASGNVIGLGADGQPLKDANASTLGIGAVVNDFFNQDGNGAYLKQTTGGHGGSGHGGDSGGGGGKQTVEDFTKEMAEKGIQANSPEFNTHLRSRIEAGTIAV